MKALLSAYRLQRVFTVLLVAATLIPATGASAQSASLVLSPSSGDPPAVRGTLSGSGWCNPASSVTVSGPGVTGSADIGRDGSLSGTFSVTGSAGDVVMITVSPMCRAGSISASAPFTFNGPPTRTPIPRPVITRTPTSTATPRFTLTARASPTVTATTTATPVPLVQFDQPLTLTVVGCSPPASDVKVEFAAAGLVGGGQDQVQEDEKIQALPAVQVPVESTGNPQVFTFLPPEVNPAWLYKLTPMISSPECAPTSSGGASQTGAPSDLWIPGNPHTIVVVPPGTSELLASSLQDKPPSEDTSKEFGVSGAWVTYHEAAGSPAGYSQVFKWSTDLAIATGGELQISVLPFPSDPASSLTTPPGVVLTKEVSCANCTFVADLSALDPHPLATQGSASQSLISKLGSFFKVAWNSIQLGVKSLVSKITGGGEGVTLAQGPMPLPPGQSPGDYLTAGQGSPLLITEYYFRVVPRLGEQVVGAATNTVRIKFFADGGLLSIKIPECATNPNAADCPPPVPPGPKPYIVEIISYHGVIPSIRGHVDCYIASKTTTIKTPYYNWTIKAWMTSETVYPKDTKFCPPKPKSKSWLEAIVSIVVDGFNWVSQAYEDLKSEVVNVVAEFVPSDLCGKKCLGTILEGTLAAIGIPPSIPNFDKLMDQGLDYVAAQAVEQLPVPPGLGQLAEEEFKKQAEAKFKEGLQAGIEAAKLALSKSVSYVPDGVPVVPDPQGSTQPATLVLRITRDPNVPEAPGTCSTSAKPTEANLALSSYVSQSVMTPEMQVFNDVHNGPGPGEGPDLTTGGGVNLYENEAIPLPSLAPSQSMTVPVLLTPVLTWGTGHGFLSPLSQAEAWSAMYHGGLASISVFNPCASGDSLSVQADGTW